MHVLGRGRTGAVKEFGDDFAKDDYINAALNLASSKADYKTIFSKNLSGGRVATYNKAINELVFTQNGVVTSLYKPKLGSADPNAGFNYYKGLKQRR